MTASSDSTPFCDSPTSLTRATTDITDPSLGRRRSRSDSTGRESLIDKDDILSDNGSGQLHRVEAKCLGDAITRWKETQKSDRRRFNKFSRRLEGDTVAEPLTSGSLISLATKAHKTMEGEGRKPRSALLKTKDFLQENARAIDVLIQHDPFISALVWGGVRVLLHALIDSDQASEITAEGLLAVVEQARLTREILSLVGHEHSVQDALTNFHFYELNFLMLATERLEKKPFARLAQSFCRSEKEILAKALTQMQDRAAHFRDMAQWEYNRNAKLSNEDTRRLLNNGPSGAANIVPLLNKEIVSEAALDLSRLAGRLLYSFVQPHRKPRHDAEVGSPVANDLTRPGETANDMRIIDWFQEQAHPITARTEHSTTAANGSWLIKHLKFQSWLASASSGLLWVCGSPGCGKSYLSQVIKGYLQQHWDAELVLSHAFQATTSRRSTAPISLVASILHNLLPSGSTNETQQEALSKLRCLHSEYKSVPESCPFDPAWRVCAKLLREQSSFILVIDALDECDFREPNEATTFVREIQALLQSSTTGKAIIFTKSSVQLEAGISSNPPNNEILITPEDTHADLKTFVWESCQQLKLPGRDRSLVTERVDSSAEGSFQWTKLFMDEVKQAHDSKSLQILVKEFPSACWEVYLRTWRNQLKGWTPTEQDYSRHILLILLGAQKMMTIEMVTDALELYPDRAPLIISRLCEPLVAAKDNCLHLGHASVREFLLSDPQEMRSEGFSFSQTESDAAMARKCLECLLRPRYASLDRIGQRLSENLETDKTTDGKSTDDPETSFYDYAAQYWDIHLTKLECPKLDLMKLAGKFLCSRQFAYWAEYGYTGNNDFRVVRATLIRLKSWMAILPEEMKEPLSLDAYFERPYQDLTQAYRQEDKNKILQWLSLSQLGLYLFDTGQISKMGQVRKKVAAGLSGLLGPRHRLALKARSDAAYAPFFKGELLIAHEIYVGVARDQLLVDPEHERTDLFTTLTYQGRAEYMMNDTPKALDTISDAMDGFLRQSGSKSHGYLVAVIWYAQVRASTGDIRTSIKEIEGVRETREKKFGPDDAFVMTVCLFIGNLYRICGEKEEALTNIRRGVEYRRQFLPISDLGASDPAILLAVAYRDFGLHEDADVLVRELETNGMLEDPDRFLRLCQIRHLRSLLLFDDGETNDAIKILQALVIDTDREHSNRALMWIRLDLASMLRYRRGEGDSKTASSLFDGIVADQRGGGPGDEPDPPRLLKLAERALRLVRSGAFDKAEDLLHREKLKWAREGDLWLSPGMPGADTTCMQPPRGLGSGESHDTGWVNVRSGP